VREGVRACLLTGTNAFVDVDVIPMGEERVLVGGTTVVWGGLVRLGVDIQLR
jgi:hypothetical protein